MINVAQPTREKQPNSFSSIRINLYYRQRENESDITSRESNLMFTLSSDKDRRNSLSRFLFAQCK